MDLSLTRVELAAYVHTQMKCMFPDDGDLYDILCFVDRALARLEHCFSNHRLKGYRGPDGNPRFNHRHADQYATFLYYLANSTHRLSPGHPIADKAYALNRALNGFDAYYEVELPDIFAVQHPVGTVLGRASYADHFLVYQNCTVGSNLAGDHPSFGKGVVMYGGSRVIGKTHVGDNSMIQTGAIIMDAGELPPNSVLHGVYPDAGPSQSRRNVVADIFMQ
jgi:serine O-acetyltransferase